MNREYAEGSERVEFGDNGESRAYGTVDIEVVVENAADLEDMDKELRGLASGAE